MLMRWLYDIVSQSRSSHDKSESLALRPEELRRFEEAVVVIGVDCLLGRGKPARQTASGLACFWRGSNEQTCQTQHQHKEIVTLPAPDSDSPLLYNTSKGTIRHGVDHRGHGNSRYTAI